eukprot:TRINITY_DN6401_c0_g1_i4.p1 TRINITY_DN6401_c0_g1~~TRINITY_DN6401_c0_g1_i4.p1  ORF type:complete len:431 (+),score=81.93 TRINITY_DN6401_c0_g1_i4:247-1539(+)
MSVRNTRIYLTSGSSIMVFDIAYCHLFGCATAVGNATCTEGEDLSYRICTCVYGYTEVGNSVLYGSDSFTGCRVVNYCYETNPKLKHNCSSDDKCVTLPVGYYCCTGEDTSNGKECVGPALSKTGKIILGVVLGVFVLLLLILLYFLRQYQRTAFLAHLPPFASNLYKHYYTYQSQWVKNKDPNQTAHFYSHSLEPNTELYDQMMQIYTNNLGGGPEVPFKSAVGVYNPTLVGSFINHKKVLEERFKNNPALFQNKGWLAVEEDLDQRQWVYSHLRLVIDNCPWNAAEIVSTIPTAHGTSMGTGTAICKTGFASLSSLDKGWYGQGIYFTCNAPYAKMYFSKHQDPALLISLIIPGNCYPVIEHPEKENALVGAAMKAGYNSHWVVVKPNGTVPKKVKKNVYTEIVVAQEAQIIPVYLLEMTFAKDKNKR